MPYCTNCGTSLNQTDKFCAACGSENTIRITQSEGYATQGSGYDKISPESNSFQANSYQSPLPAYYMEEFEKIRQSSETYKGKFNFAAFLWGPFWAFYRGLILPAIIALVISLLTAGLGAVVYWFIFGVLGNWMVYNLHTKNKQLPF